MSVEDLIGHMARQGRLPGHLRAQVNALLLPVGQDRLSYPAGALKGIQLEPLGCGRQEPTDLGDVCCRGLGSVGVAGRFPLGDVESGRLGSAQSRDIEPVPADDRGNALSGACGPTQIGDRVALGSKLPQAQGAVIGRHGAHWDCRHVPRRGGDTHLSDLTVAGELPRDQRADEEGTRLDVRLDHPSHRLPRHLGAVHEQGHGVRLGDHADVVPDAVGESVRAAHVVGSAARQVGGEPTTLREGEDLPVRVGALHLVGDEDVVGC